MLILGILFSSFINPEYRILLQEVDTIWEYAWAPIGLITIILGYLQTSKPDNILKDQTPTLEGLTQSK